MLAVAGILVQEITRPDVFFYNAGVPENLPNLYFGGPTGAVRNLCLHALHGVWHRGNERPNHMLMVLLQVNLGGLLAWEFLLMHWVEVRRWQVNAHPCTLSEGHCE